MKVVFMLMITLTFIILKDCHKLPLRLNCEGFQGAFSRKGVFSRVFSRGHKVRLVKGHSAYVCLISLFKERGLIWIVREKMIQDGHWRVGTPPEVHCAKNPWNQKCLKIYLVKWWFAMLLQVMMYIHRIWMVYIDRLLGHTVEDPDEL